MGETIVVIAIVAIAIAFSARSLYRTLTGKDEGCSCSSGSCSQGECPELPHLEIGGGTNKEVKSL